LFWKRKKRDKEKELLFVFEDPANRREFVRVRPLPSQPVKINFGGRTADLIDISAGGLACRGGQGSIGEVKPVRFDLPGEKVTIDTDARILARSGENNFHCQFVNLPDPMFEAIHHYVLEVQKEEIRQKKARAKKGRPQK
jgi:hypothetical protein